MIPDLQLIAQLEKELEREQMMLDEEEMQLNNLTKNASREESARKAQMKKVLTFDRLAYLDAPTVEG